MKRILSIIGIAALLVTALGVLVAPAAAQTAVTWTAEYYDNPNLSGSAELRRQESTIAYNWGSGSPASGVDNDTFSVRWGTDVYLPAGTYRFYALVDDNVRITLNYGSPLIDTFNAPRIGELIQADVVVGEGTHHIQVDYRELEGDAYVFVSFANLATNPVGPNFSAPANVPVAGGSWTAQYYANPNLGGSPTLIQSEDNPSENWGFGSPAPSIPADNWSARWTGALNLPGGTYTLTVRADDGVRIYVDGVLYINEFHGFTGQTYTATFNLSQGAHSVLIEYYDALSNAYLDYNLTQTTGGVFAPTPIPAQQPIVQQPVPTGATATINTGRLNVRAAPDPVFGQVLTRVNRGEVYSVVGQNTDGSWVQINVNGTIGWVNAGYVVVSNAGSIPAPAPAATVSPSGLTARIVADVNVRSGPSTTFGVLARLRRGEVVPLVGRSFDSRWYQVNVNGTVGFIYRDYATPSGAITGLPVAG